MKRYAPVIAVAFTLASCSKVPETKAPEITGTAATESDVVAQKKSIEEAADEAAKLVEADAAAETARVTGSTDAR
jgi:PBP1b-binding outer membrane lipoprotein LpoB